MIDIVFLNAERIWPIVFGAILLWALFVYKEWNGQNSLRFWLRSMIGLIAIVALALIFLKPTFLSEGKINTAVLLTEGYDKEQFDSIKKENKNIVVLNYEKGEAILDDNQKIASLVILGEGIQDYDLWQFKDFPVQYLRNRSKSGIAELSYDFKNQLGKDLIIDGKYLKRIAASKLVLKAPGNIAVDSVILSNQKEQIFKLSTKLNVEGNFLYQLIEKDSAGKLQTSNPIPVSVLKRVPLKVLMIEGFPTFENKYLKNYLAQSGQEVSVRTQITTGRYKYEYFNIEKKKPISFSEEVLKSVDLLVIGNGSLKNLSKSESTLLKRMIKENGLGVFIQPSLDLLNSKLELASLKFKRDNKTTTQLDSISKIQINKYPYHFLPEDGLQPIIFTENETLAAYNKLGFGRIGTSVFKNTYQLILDGNSEAYQNLWTDIIDNLSKRKKATSELRTIMSIAFKDEPLEFILRTNMVNPIVNSAEGKIPLKQDINLSNKWTGMLYPRNKGWNSLSLDGDSTATLDYYVNENEVWNSVLSQNTSEENRRFFENSSSKSNIQKFRKPINPLWFFGIFLLAMGYLWLAPKLTEA